MKRIYEPDVYNMHYHDISVAIYQWADFQVTMPENTSNIDYASGKMREALEICRAEKLDWYPLAETYKGKSQKHIGKIYVCVVMPNGQNYGFMYHEEYAEKIMTLLDGLWKDYIHGDV